MKKPFNVGDKIKFVSAQFQRGMYGTIETIDQDGLFVKCIGMSLSLMFIHRRQVTHRIVKRKRKAREWDLYFNEGVVTGAQLVVGDKSKAYAEQVRVRAVNLYKKPKEGKRITEEMLAKACHAVGLPTNGAFKKYLNALNIELGL